MLSHKSIKNHLNEPTNDHRRISGRNKLVTVSLLLFVGPERNILRAKEPYRFSYPPYFAVQPIPALHRHEQKHTFVPPLYTHAHTSSPLLLQHHIFFFFLSTLAALRTAIVLQNATSLFIVSSSIASPPHFPYFRRTRAPPTMPRGRRGLRPASLIPWNVTSK